MMPGEDGLALAGFIRATSAIPVILLTARAEEMDRIVGLELGADDYVTKPFSPRQLVARVCAVLRRSGIESLAPTDVWSFNGGDLVIDEPRHEVRRAGHDIALTPNEFKILISMARHPSKAFTREELIAFAIGDEYAGMDRVIDTHVKNLRQKIEMDPKAPVYILTIYGIGYKFGGKSDENQP
jgi:DNA-binding response OmpR family regulator